MNTVEYFMKLITIKDQYLLIAEESLSPGEVRSGLRET